MVEDVDQGAGLPIAAAALVEFVEREVGGGAVFFEDVVFGADRFPAGVPGGFDLADQVGRFAIPAGELPVWPRKVGAA